jgi:hypothetical protein
VSVESTSAAPPPPLPPPWPPRGSTGDWELVGPKNIGDDVYLAGEAGTLADAVSPAANPSLIYAGGQNNGASSGVLKSTDMGRTWRVASRGLFVTKVQALHIVDGQGEHVLVGVAGAIYESFDAAESWHLVSGSQRFGTCNTFKRGTIGGVEHVLAGCSAGIANAPATRGGAWNVIPAAGLARTYLSVSGGNGDGTRKANSVVGACMGEVVFGSIINATSAEWRFLGKEWPCVMLALDPNDAQHFLYTHPPTTYRSLDGGKTRLSCNHSNVFHAGIDQHGVYYTAAMGGAFRSQDRGASWQAFYDVRVARRTNVSRTRVPHDYQRIALDFGGSVAFPSDQGLFIVNGSSDLKLISANGNLSNNIAMQVAVSAGEGPNKRYLVTSAWDWAPLASWDSGAHWPSWQTEDDGASGACIGEGGGAYGMGLSNHMLLMHRHNILASARGGKDLRRFVVPHGATVFGPAYARRRGSRTEPSGLVFAPIFMGTLPWDITFDRRVACVANQTVADLGVYASNASCLSAADLGNAYGWYKGMSYVVWRGDTDRRCCLCNLTGNASAWSFVPAPGAASYVLRPKAGAAAAAITLRSFDINRDGKVDARDLRATQGKQSDGRDHDDDQADDSGHDGDGSQTYPHDEVHDQAKLEKLTTSAAGLVADRAKLRGRLFAPPGAGLTGLGGEVGLQEGGAVRTGLGGYGGALAYVGRNADFGLGNWSWVLLPPHLQGLRLLGFVTDPTDGGEALYALFTSCIAVSRDQGDTWGPCWTGWGLVGPFSDLVIKDSHTMLVMRSRSDVPLRTTDGGHTWVPLRQLATIASWSTAASWSWTGTTLVLQGGGGEQSTAHPHYGFVWRSLDDGDTWTDETGNNLVTMGASGGQWFEDVLYLNSGGQGIMRKKMEG